MIQKNIHIVSFQGNSNPFAPVLWVSAKTYYEKYGKYPERYKWILPTYELEKRDPNWQHVKDELKQNPPDFFGVSLYVWNFAKTMEVCKYVKETYPNCIIVTGGPQQYFKHNKDWFLRYYFIDASLPSEVYGEIAITDMFDNWNHDTNVIDWFSVEQILFPTKDRHTIIKSTKATYKRDFKWDYAPVKEQEKHLENYARYYYDDQLKLMRETAAITTKKAGSYESPKHKTFESSKWMQGIGMLQWKLETTRGCPYACTFCDWGGGVMSKVIKRDLKYIKEDLDVITRYGNTTLYICDANFGINGDRDVEILRYIVDKKQKYYSKRKLYLHYGGYAKTNQHFDTLKEIFTLEAENDLGHIYKISVQSFNQSVLEHVKRTDLREDEHWQLSKWLQETYDYQSQVEIIVGLPGMTLDIWYEEFEHCYNNNAELRAYEWHLLPESEAYGEAYRKKYEIVTTKRITHDSEWHIPAEVVIGTMSYTKEDYIQMWLVYCLYLLFWRAGIYDKTIRDLIYTKKVLTFGQLLKKVKEEVYPVWFKNDVKVFEEFEKHMSFVLVEDNETTDLIRHFRIMGKGYTHVVVFFTFLMARYFIHFNKMDPIMKKFLVDLGADPKLVEEDSLHIMSAEKITTGKFAWVHSFMPAEYTSLDKFLQEFLVVLTYSTTKLLEARVTES